jgi:hypothetical protein
VIFPLPIFVPVPSAPMCTTYLGFARSRVFVSRCPRHIFPARDLPRGVKDSHAPSSFQFWLLYFVHRFSLANLLFASSCGQHGEALIADGLILILFCCRCFVLSVAGCALPTSFFSAPGARVHAADFRFWFSVLPCWWWCACNLVEFLA